MYCTITGILYKLPLQTGIIFEIPHCYSKIFVEISNKIEKPYNSVHELFSIKFIPFKYICKQDSLS